MRYLIIAGILIALVYASCESTPENKSIKVSTMNVSMADTHTHSTTELHEIRSGKAGECEACGEVLQSKVENDGTIDQTGNPAFACSTHQEVTGQKDTKCSKCEKRLTDVIAK